MQESSCLTNASSCKHVANEVTMCDETEDEEKNNRRSDEREDDRERACKDHSQDAATESERRVIRSRVYSLEEY